MVLILKGNAELGEHVRSNLGYLPCLRHLLKSRVVTTQIYLPKRKFFPLHACATRSELPSYIITINDTSSFKSYDLLDIKVTMRKGNHILILI